MLFGPASSRCSFALTPRHPNQHRRVLPGLRSFFVANRSVCDPWDFACLWAICGGLLDDGHDACVVIPRVTPGHGEVAAHAPLVGEGGMSRVPVDVNQHVAVHGVEAGAADVESHPDFPVAWDT